MAHLESLNSGSLVFLSKALTATLQYLSARVLQYSVQRHCPRIPRTGRCTDIGEPALKSENQPNSLELAVSCPKSDRARNEPSQ